MTFFFFKLVSLRTAWLRLEITLGCPKIQYNKRNSLHIFHIQAIPNQFTREADIAVAVYKGTASWTSVLFEVKGTVSTDGVGDVRTDAGSPRKQHPYVVLPCSPLPPHPSPYMGWDHRSSLSTPPPPAFWQRRVLKLKKPSCLDVWETWKCMASSHPELTALATLPD